MGHFLDLPLLVASTAIRILSRWVERTRSNLPSWPAVKSGWTASVRTIMSQTGFLETPEPWVWTHPNTGPFSLKYGDA